MSQLVIAVVGFFVVGVTFLIGLLIGFVAGAKKMKDKAEEWIDEECCYECKEKFEYEEARPF